MSIQTNLPNDSSQHLRQPFAEWLATFLHPGLADMNALMKFVVIGIAVIGCFGVAATSVIAQMPAHADVPYDGHRSHSLDVSPGDVMATICQLSGVDTTIQIPDSLDWPHEFVPKGTVIEKILA